MIKDYYYKGSDFEKAKDLFATYLGKGFLELIEDIKKEFSLGKITSFSLNAKYEINDMNKLGLIGEIVLTGDNGEKIYIEEYFDEIDHLYMGIRNIETDIKKMNEIRNKISDYFKNFLDDPLYDVLVALITDLKERDNIYIIDKEINLNNYTEKEREILTQALKILKTA
jgi:uncharacterized membrane protein